MVSVIIVNFKTPYLLTRCIEKIYSNSNFITVECIIIDNASNDNSELITKEKFPDVIWINNPSNEGFGRANNIGALSASGEYILFLNSDAVILNETLIECIKKIESDPLIGILGCKLLNPDGTPQKSTFSIASIRKMLDQNLIINKLWPMGEEPAEAVMGSFMLIPRKVLDECGLFDPDFFMYCEELELCHRIAKKGYRIEYFDGATAIHEHGGSTTNKEWGMKQRYLSTALLFLKVRGYSGYLLYHLLFIFNAATNFFAMWFLDRNWRRDYLQAQQYYFSNFGYYLMIPFLYSPKPGNGKRMLKRDP